MVRNQNKYIESKKDECYNPNITRLDYRIWELDCIVQEVKASEEWEAVKMNILEIGIEKGTQIGIQQKLLEQVEKKLKKGCSVEEIADMLEENVETIQKIVDELKK